MAAVATDALPIPDAESVDDENSLGEEGSEEEDDDPPPRLRRSSLSLRSISRCGVVVVVAGRAPFSSRDTRRCLCPSQRPLTLLVPPIHTPTHILRSNLSKSSKTMDTAGEAPAAAGDVTFKDPEGSGTDNVTEARPSSALAELKVTVDAFITVLLISIRLSDFLMRGL